MRALALSTSLLASAFGAEPYLPRFSQVTSGVTFYTNWEVRDVDGDGMPDLAGVPQPGYGSRMGGILRNLGNRSFAAPAISHFVEVAGPGVDTDNHYLQLDDSPELEIFFSQTDIDTFRHIPMMVKLGKAGQYGQRIPLAPESDEVWHPIDLDADGGIGFLSTPSNSLPLTQLTLWERGQDGSYTSQHLPLDGEIEPFGDASVSDLDQDGDLDLVVSDNDHI